MKNAKTGLSHITSRWPSPQAHSAFRLLTFSFLLSSVLHAAQPKEALLIANGKYSHFAGLAHPSPDAAKLSAALEQLGFRVRVVRDGNREQMLDAIAEFERELRNTGAIAFFHYGGHGVQVDGKNYLLPADADIPDERRVATRAVALDEVMTAMDAAAARASIIVIDACRDNPLPAGSGRNLARGLSVVGMKPKNSMVIYAAEAGSKALDGLFTPILAVALQQKGRTIDQVMKSVRSEVYAKSGGQQTPGEYNQLFEELFLGETAGGDLTPEAIFTAMRSPTPHPAIMPEVKEKDALADLKELARQGNANAQFNLGLCYSDGDGVDKDQVEAVKWYRKAAEQGFADAQFNLGVCYSDGEGVIKDAGEAVKWYRKAAEQGHASAQFNLGLCYSDGDGMDKDQVEAVKWYRKAAEQGFADAQGNLGVCYANGEGVAKNHTEAVKWWRKAAEQGGANAQGNLGVCYANGEGVAKNQVEAVKWYRKAAEQGFAPAQFNLGTYYAEGKVVAKDQVEAVKWFRKAAEQGFAAAQFNLGVIYADGRGVAKDAVEAMQWYRKAAEQGDADAQLNIGNCYYNGRGVAKDAVEAYAFYNLASVTNVLALKNRDLLAKEMTREQVAAAQKRTKELQKELGGN
jgi:TPR repeat protein